MNDGARLASPAYTGNAPPTPSKGALILGECLAIHFSCLGHPKATNTKSAPDLLMASTNDSSSNDFSNGGEKRPATFNLGKSTSDFFLIFSNTSSVLPKKNTLEPCSSAKDSKSGKTSMPATLSWTSP